MSAVVSGLTAVEKRLVYRQDEEVPSLSVQPNGVDLTVKEIYKVDGSLVVETESVKLPNFTLLKRHATESGTSYWKLRPGHVYQVEFKEHVDFPSEYCGVVFIRSSLSKSGCTGENGLFDSGYRGSTGMTLEVSLPTMIHEDSRLAQMVVLYASVSGILYSGRYQDSDGPLSW